MAERRLVYARTLCFVQSGDDVLMLKGAPTKRLYPNLWNGVGGHLEAGEDILSSVRREVKEETGLEIADARLRAIVHADEEGKSGVVFFVFTARSQSRELSPSGEGEVSRIPRHRLMELDLVEDLRQLLPIVLGSQESERSGDRGGEHGGLWFGHLGYDAAGKLSSFRGRFGGQAP
jgi:8-oxo-dGTP diphosphatase